MNVDHKRMNSHPQQRNKRLARRWRYGTKGNKSNKSSKNGGSKSSKSGAYNNQYTKSGKGSTTKASKSKSSKANIFTHNNIGGSKSSSKSAKANTNNNLFTSETNFDVHVISPHIPPPPFTQTNSPTTKPIVYMHSCTGEPCPLDTQCRSPGGMCGTNCNALSIWNSSCPKITQEEKVLNTPTPTVQPTTPYINELECTGLPCTGENREVSMAVAFLMKSSGIPLCRSVNGACGSGTLYCNTKSIWKEDCPSNSPTLKPTIVETLAPVSEQPVSYSAPPTSSQPTIMQTNEPTVTLIPTCLLVQTDMSNSGGYIDVYVNDGSGSGIIEATTPNIIYSESQVVLDECYDGLVGVQIRNPTPRPWMGSITTSINNKLNYFPMNCDDCTIGLNFTELLDYTPPPSSGEEIMITTETIVVDGNDMNEQGGGVALCLNGLDENGGNSCTLRNMATFQPTSLPTDTVSPTPQVDSSAAEDASAVVEVEIAVPSTSSSDEAEEISPDDFESNKEIVSPSSSGTTSDSSTAGFPIGGYIGIGVVVLALLAMLLVVKKMRTRRQKRCVEEVNNGEENDEDELIDQQNDESFESRPYSPSESEDSDSD